MGFRIKKVGTTSLRRGTHFFRFYNIFLGDIPKDIFFMPTLDYIKF